MLHQLPSQQHQRLASLPVSFDGISEHRITDGLHVGFGLTPVRVWLHHATLKRGG